MLYPYTQLSESKEDVIKKISRKRKYIHIPFVGTGKIRVGMEPCRVSLCRSGVSSVSRTELSHREKPVRFIPTIFIFPRFCENAWWSKYDSCSVVSLKMLSV